MLLMDVLERIRRFLFHPTKEFTASKDETLGDAARYYVPLLTIVAAIVAVAVTAVVLILGVVGISGIGKFAPLLGVGAFVGIIAVGILAVLYIAVWLHIWVYLLGGRKGLTQTVKAVTFGVTPILILWWLPGPNVLLAPIWALILVILGVMVLHELSQKTAIFAVILAILVPLVLVGIVAAAVVLPMLL
ncbi:MAG: YIP1 family protein [Methanosarcinales archaeon]|nr:YIP1 family protein [Methanosarcinales archaeon]